MNSATKRIIKNIASVIFSNGITLLVSVLLTLFVPKILGVEEFAYWQLYIFYISYVGFFHFGWIDGIYLKIGGAKYRDLDYPNLSAQFSLLIIFETIIASLIAVGSFLFIGDATKKIIFMFVAFCGVITTATTFLLYILQSTNRIKEYAKYTRYDRYIYFILTMIYLSLGGRNVFFLMAFDVIARLLILILCMLTCQEVVLPPYERFPVVIKEIGENIAIGSSLMFANIASMLIVGVIRLGIERQWSVTVFGKVSLMLSISNLVLRFVSAVGVVMFPLLRRIDKKHLVQLYEMMRTLLMPLLYGCLLLYYPMKIILTKWLPAYTDSFVYMSILFPIFIYEGKMSLLISTYLKTLRKEKTILLVNVTSVCVSLLLTGIFAVYFHNLTLTILSIVFVLIFRSTFGEYLLNKELKLKIFGNILLETLLTATFIFVSYFGEMKMSFFVYLAIYLVFLFSQKTRLKNAAMYFKNKSR